MKKDSVVHNMIDNEKVKKIRDYLLKSLDSTDDNGNPDLEKIQRNATYNMGECSIDIAGILLEQNLNLATLEKQRKVKAKEVYEETMTTRMAFSPTHDGVRTMVAGDETLAELDREIQCTKDFIEFLRTAQSQINFYPSNAKVVLEYGKYGRDIGKLL